MQSLKYFFVLLVFTGLSLVGCSDEVQAPKSADQTSLEKVTIREFTATNTPVGVINPGIITYPDGKAKVRFYVDPTEFVATYLPGDVDPDILSGPGEVEHNGLIDINTFAGHWQGKAKLIPVEAGGGIWQFTWHGTSEFNPTGWQGGPGVIITIHDIGHGEGGDIHGMQCRIEVIVYAPLDFSAWYGEYTGVIISH